MAGPWADFQAAAPTPGPWADFAPGATAPIGRIEDVGDAILNGLRSSSAGLALRGKMAEKAPDADTPWYLRALYGGGQLVGDLPAGVVGAVGGGALGTSVAGPAGTVIGGGAGGFAVPMAIREALMQAYSTGHAVSWADAWDIAKAGLKGAGKGAIIGGLTAGAGRVVGAVVPGTALAKGTAATGAELATMTTAASAIEGHMPTAQDFMDSAILLGGLKGAMATAKALRATYSATGKTPSKVLADAQADPTLKADLEAGKVPTAYEPVSFEQQVKAAVNANATPETVRKALTDPNWQPKMDEPLPVVTEYITDRASLAGVYGEVAKANAKEIDAITRGVRTNKETMADAYAMVFGGKLEEHKAGMAANAETTAARLLVAKSALVRAAQATEALKANPLDAKVKLDFYAAIELLSQVQKEARGAAAEWGRAGQIQRAIKNDPSMLIDAESLLTGIERKMPIADVMAMFNKLKDPANKMKFAEGYMEATTMQKVVEAWRAGLFSGPLTWEANVLGNVTRYAVETLKAPIQASLYALDRKASGDPLNMAQFAARAFAPYHGLKLAVLDGLHLAKEGLELVKTEGVEGLKKVGEAISTEAAKNDERIDVQRRANTGVTGKFVGFSFGMLKMQDLPFRTIGERAEAYVQAIDRASREYHPSSTEFKEAVAKYVNDPTAGLTAERALTATKAIEQAGSEAVFAQRMGPRMEKFSSAINGTGWQFVFAAIKTPANLLDYSIQHTPGLNFLSSRWRADWEAGGERKAAAAARIVVGTAIAATAYSMAEDGLLTGGNLADKETGGTKTGAGIQAYSVKIGDKYYSIQRIEPVAKVAMLAADLIEIINSPKITDEDKTKAKAMLVLAFANATISTTYLSGLASLMKATLDPDRYGENFVESYASTAVPKVIGQTVTLADPYKREVDGALDAIQAQIPFLREKLIPKRDVWGELAKNDKLFSVLPIQQTEASKDLVKTEAVRLWLGIADAPEFAEERAPLNARDKQIKLTQEQRDIYRQVAGKNAMEILSPIVNDPDWKKLPDFVQVEIYKDVLKDSRKLAEYTALPPDSDVREKLREKVQGIIQRQINQAETGNKPGSGERRVK